ncbi:hypothetical protein PR003_g23326 [Phytophthora rubi]|uniref:Replication protein A OB domain-containing protein n=1 Tax=Phytophthora rubi TaxID=129364 RepID=A0A6A3ICJ6_9STRA|nr:hypothetical protein PR001_g24370 [Phytophthora rubi]KAE8984336.1 hypothetical protein PR002_g22977 [Phytophthora rubi]KAE9298104.1 hypothetical protein PR003_g23326 [Phytophthora rubi]
MGADHPAVARERKTAIRELSPGLPPGWFVEARVMNLAPVRTWGNPKGTGKIIVMELMDSSGGRTQAKAFNESAVRFGELVQFDRVYAIRGGSVRKANPDYANFTHQHELHLSQDTSVEELPNDDSIPHAEMSFVTIEDPVTCPLGSYVDLIAVVIDVGEVDCVVGRNDEVQKKRDILLVDTSNVQVLCTLWNEFSCLPVDGWLQEVIAIRRGRLTDFQGRSIGTTAKTSIMANPDFPDERGALEQWFQD